MGIDNFLTHPYDAITLHLSTSTCITVPGFHLTSGVTVFKYVTEIQL